MYSTVTTVAAALVMATVCWAADICWMVSIEELHAAAAGRQLIQESRSHTEQCVITSHNTAKEKI